MPSDQLNRRQFITLIGGAAAWPLAARAQQPPEVVRRIGYLTPGRALPQIDTAFVETLRELGWIEGRNILFEFRYAENNADRLARMAAELVRLNVDVIVARSTPGPVAAKRATTRIPIVMAGAGDPLGT